MSIRLIVVNISPYKQALNSYIVDFKGICYVNYILITFLLF